MVSQMEGNNNPVRCSSPPPKTLAKIREERKRKKREREAEKDKKRLPQLNVRQQKIPLFIRPILVSLHDQGMSYRKIVRLLNDAYGIKVSRSAVYYHIKRFRQYKEFYTKK